MTIFTNIWNYYKDYIQSITKNSCSSSKSGIIYWRDNVFANLILYIIPISLIALIPDVYVAFKSGQPFLAAFNFLTAFLIFGVSLNKRFSLNFRKIFILFMLYMLALVLIVKVGLSGPGTIYLLATTVFTALIFSNKVAFLTVAAHVLTCAFLGAIIYFKPFGLLLTKDYTLVSWIAFSSNLIFLSLVCVILISKIITGLKQTIKQELQLRIKLEQEAVERTKLNERLQESEGHYKSLFVQNPSPMWVYDPQTLRILWVNDAAIRNYGYTKEEFLTMTLNNVRIDKADIRNLRKLVSENVGVGISDHYVTKHCTKDKNTFDVDVRCNTIKINGKDARLVIARDITMQVNHIRAIEEQNQKLQKIAFIQSHLVRAPLARIMGLVDIISKYVDEKPDPVLLGYLDQSAKEFDQIVINITQHTEQFQFNGQLTSISKNK
jgi:PAS domain S-box-containing protein